MVLNNIVDIVIALFIIINLYNGWRRGMILSIFNFASVIVAFLVSKKFSNDFSKYLFENVNWFESLKENLVINIDNSFVTDSEIIKDIGNETFLNKLNLPESLSTHFNEFILNIDLTKENQLNTVLSEVIVNVILNLMSFLLLFVLILLVIKIIGVILNTIFKLPLLKGINQLGGFIFGFVLSNIYIMVFMAILVLLNSIGMDFGLKNLIDKSVVGKLYYENNILFYLINYYL